MDFAQLQDAVVRMCRDNMQPAEIREALGITRGQVSGIISRAREKGLLEKSARTAAQTLWTPEQREKVLKLWGDGLTAAQIGSRMGVSKNAIIGIVHRAKAKDHAVPRHVRKQSSNTRKLKMMRALSPAPRKSRDLKMTPVPLPREEDIPRVAFADLEPHHCRFICCAEAVPAVQSGAKMFCGLPTVAGTSWCEGHLARVSPAATMPVRERNPWAPLIEAAEEMPA